MRSAGKVRLVARAVLGAYIVALAGTFLAAGAVCKRLDVAYRVERLRNHPKRLASALLAPEGPAEAAAAERLLRGEQGKAALLSLVLGAFKRSYARHWDLRHRRRLEDVEHAILGFDVSPGDSRRAGRERLFWFSIRCDPECSVCPCGGCVHAVSEFSTSRLWLPPGAACTARGFRGARAVVLDRLHAEELFDQTARGYRRYDGTPEPYACSISRDAPR